MTRIDHEKNNKKARALNGDFPDKGNASLRGIKLSEPIVTYGDLLKGSHIRNFQEEANTRIKSPRELRIAYQRIACSCILELGQHRDIRQIARMFNAMPTEMRPERMEKFLTTFGQVSSSRDDDGNTQFRFDRKKRPQLGPALEQPWWMCKS